MSSRVRATLVGCLRRAYCAGPCRGQPCHDRPSGCLPATALGPQHAQARVYRVRAAPSGGRPRQASAGTVERRVPSGVEVFRYGGPDDTVDSASLGFSRLAAKREFWLRMYGVSLNPTQPHSADDHPAPRRDRVRTPGNGALLCDNRYAQRGGKGHPPQPGRTGVEAYLWLSADPALSPPPSSQSYRTDAEQSQAGGFRSRCCSQPKINKYRGTTVCACNPRKCFTLHAAQSIEVIPSGLKYAGLNDGLAE
jgi:hypothetical protein